MKHLTKASSRDLAVEIQRAHDRLMWALEARGLTVTREGDQLVIRPTGQLTEDDRAALRRWRWHVLALLDYQAPEL